MIEAKGTVTDVDGLHAEVRMDAGGCGRCHEEGGCGGHNLGTLLCRTPPVYRVLNPAKFAVGARVTIVVAEGVVRHVAMLAYGLPLLLLLGGAALGTVLFGDIAGIGMAGLGLLSGLALSRILQRQMGKTHIQQPYIRH